MSGLPARWPAVSKAYYQFDPADRLRLVEGASAKKRRTFWDGRCGGPAVSTCGRPAVSTCGRPAVTTRGRPAVRKCGGPVRESSTRSIQGRVQSKSSSQIVHASVEK